MLTIAAVNIGNYRGMGARYVNALFSGCARNLTVPFNFVCLTDDANGLRPEIKPQLLDKGLVPPHLHPVYWKLALFRPGAFREDERVLFMDLDIVILSNIDDIASYAGPFAMVREPYFPAELNSSIMAFRPRHCDLWTKWASEGFPEHRVAEQGWIADRLNNAAVRLQDVFPGRIRSFNIDCRKLSPKPPTPMQQRLRSWHYRLFSVPYPRGASIVFFQGGLKPDNCKVPWVQDAWRG